MSTMKEGFLDDAPAIEPRRANPYLFVTGCTRSGTTLLQRMLDSHPELAVTNDSHLIPRSVFGQKVDFKTALTPALFDEITGFKRFHVLSIEHAAAVRRATESATLAEFVTALLDDYAEGRQKPLAGEKDPEYVRRLPLIHRLFPEARVIHIVRDGRDVALSTLDWVTPQRFLGRLSLWREEPIAACALWWRRQVAAGIDGGRLIGERYLEVRYEQLVQDPEAVLRDACRFLAVPYSPATIRFHEGRTVRRRSTASKDQWLPPTTGLRDWQVSLDRPKLELFEALAGDLLSEIGYRLATDPAARSQAVLRRAAECRERWHSDLALESARRLQVSHL